MASKLKVRAKVASAIGLLCLSALPTGARAQVTDLPAGRYGGMFRDESTGKIWLDYDARVDLGELGAQFLASLANSPFRLANTNDIQSLADANLLQSPAVGGFGPCVTGNAMNCKIGLYDDLDGNPDQYGFFGVNQGSSTVVMQSNQGGISYADSLGLWVVQKGPAVRPGTSPYGADFDGDGKDEKIVWRPSEGNWYVRFSGSSDVLVQQWGLPGDIPLVGDYDGDLIPDLVVWRPSNGTWYVKTSKSLYDASQAIQQQFGLPGDIPIKGDFDHDGILDFAVWRPREGNWYVLQSSNHQVVVTQWGLSNDIPVTAGKGLP